MTTVSTRPARARSPAGMPPKIRAVISPSVLRMPCTLAWPSAVSCRAAPLPGSSSSPAPASSAMAHTRPGGAGIPARVSARPARTRCCRHSRRSTLQAVLLPVVVVRPRPEDLPGARPTGSQPIDRRGLVIYMAVFPNRPCPTAAFSGLARVPPSGRRPSPHAGNAAQQPSVRWAPDSCAGESCSSRRARPRPE